MIRTIADFERLWSQELESTQTVLKHLTTESLTKPLGPDVRTLGRVAWHIVTTIPEMMERTGLKLEGVTHDAPIPATAKQIFDTYNRAAIGVLEQVRNTWKDETLLIEDDMYGEKWQRGASLLSLVLHQTHHRAQMTVLMRIAGLSVPGVYGPAKEEWKANGMEPPAV